MDNQQWKILQFPYFLGLFLGDGCISGYIVRVVGIDLDILEYAKREIDNKVSGVTNIYMNGKYHVLSILSPFTHLLGVFREKKYIPTHVYNYSEYDKREFIAGLLDADGYISMNKPKNKNYFKFSMGFVSTNMVDAFSKLLNSVGCKTGKITLKSDYGRNKNWKKCYQLHIPIYSYLDANLYFRCNRKQHRLDLYNETIRIPSTTIRKAPQLEGEDIV